MEKNRLNIYEIAKEAGASTAAGSGICAGGEDVRVCSLDIEHLQLVRTHLAERKSCRRLE